MKNVQKGFALIITVITIFLVIVVAVSVGYYVIKQNENDKLLSEESNNTNQIIPKNTATNPNLVSSGWTPSSSNSNLKPVITPDGILLTVEKKGDESVIASLIQFPQDADVLSFDMKFSKQGDGDWLTVMFNGTLLFSFGGDSFIANNDLNGYEEGYIALPSYLRGTAGIWR